MKTLLASLMGLCLFVPSTRAERVSFSVLASFDYVEGMKLPQEVMAYDEQKVTVSGFMQRETPGSGPVEFFLIVNDACGCNGTPRLNEIVFCAMPEGVKTDVKAGVVEATGKLYVGEQKQDGYVVALYVMDVESIGQ